MGTNAETRIAVVTGGTGALGREVVRELRTRGYQVHVPWRSERSMSETRALIDDHPDRIVLDRADMSDPSDVERFFRPIADAGRLDLLCNLAGGFAAGSVDQTTPEDWDRMVTTNATTTFLATRAAIPALRTGGGGAIVNVGSIPPLEGGGARMSAYAASKASVLALTKAWAKELRSEGIRVNAIAPETIDTPSNRRAMPAADRSMWINPSAIASVIAFLASDDARIVTGSVLMLRGSGQV